VDTSESKSETSGNFEMWCWRRMEKTSTDCVRNEELLYRVKEDRNILNAIKRRKANWIGRCCGGTAL
jgi:hypothetical protein